MKRFLQKQSEQFRLLAMLLVTLCGFFTASAQTPMVTLSHNGELSFFTNVGAFKAAYDSAASGDIIYLSEGEFIIDGGAIVIKKRLNIVGSGYASHILGAIKVSVDQARQMDAPLFDGVKLDNLSFDNSSIYTNLGNSEIRRTWIRKLENGNWAGTDILYDKCMIEEAEFSGTGGGNVLIKNSKLGKLKYAYKLNVVNCNIDKTDYYPRYMSSSILNTTGNCILNGECAMYNSLIRSDYNDPSLKKYNCYIKTDISLLNENLEATVDLIANEYIGLDGKEVGIHGGESPFSEYPSVPTVDSSKSSVEYDAVSNKLKVSITVKAD